VNLIDRLLNFAHGQEDVLTETLAWFLEHCSPFRELVLTAVDGLLTDHRLPGEEGYRPRPRVETQVTERDLKEGLCRYDLVLSWPGERVIFEVKVWADLTWRSDSDGEARHQLGRYLQTAVARPDMRTHLLVLAPAAFDEQLTQQQRQGFIGQLLWQDIHDLLLKIEDCDDTMMMLAVDFARALEKRHMAIPKVTLEDIGSVVPYQRFIASLRFILEAVRDRLLREGEIEGFVKYSVRDWQDEHQRIGWRYWVRTNDPHHFAFTGIYVGPDTLRPGVPDLYFMLEAPPKSRVRDAFDGKSGDITALMTSLSRDGVTWSFVPGGYETVRARMSLADLLVEERDHMAAVMRFFRTTTAALRGTPLWREFVELAGG
jgi:hypothetical protein